MFKILVAFLFIASSAFASTDVQLNLREQYSFSRTDAPMSIGIPMPKGNGVTSLDNLLIKDNSNNEAYSQFRVLARWDGVPTDTSKDIKWVLADFNADVTANSKVLYYLEYGTDVTHGTNPSPMSSSATATDITVNTNVATFVIDRRNFNLFKSVLIDGTEFIKTTNDDVIKITDSFGTNYFANNNTDSVEIEESGPERVVIKATGWHQNKTGTDSAFYGFTTRMYFYNNKTTVKVDHTLENVPLVPRGALAFTEYSFNISLDMDAGDKTYSIYGRAETTGTLSSGETLAKIYQGSNGTDYWNKTNTATAYEINNYTKFRGYKVFEDTTVLDKANYALGIMDITDSTKGVTVAINKFWQKFPKALKATRAGALTVGIIPFEFSSEGSYNHFVEDMAKLNTEVFFNFHIGAYNTTDKNEILNMLHPVIPAALPSYYSLCSAAAMPPGSIFADASPMIPYEIGVGNVTLDTMTYPLLDALDADSTSRASQGFYSAYSYGPYSSGDNAQVWKPPTNSDQFMRFMRVGVPGASSTKHTFRMADYGNENPIIPDNKLFFGGVDFVKHFIYSRAGGSPDGQLFTDLNIKDRPTQKKYYFSTNYPVFGGRVAIDSLHTLPTLVPRSSQSGHPEQPTRQWYMPEGMHIYIGGVVDYYQMTGDMAAYDWIKNFSENLLMNYLTWDIHQYGEWTGFYNDGYGNPELAVYPDTMRNYALPIADLMMAYQITGSISTLNYAKEQAKIFDVYQDKSQGYYKTPEDMSVGQVDRLMWGFIPLYDVTGDEKYFDIIEGYNNYPYYFVRNQETDYLDTYNTYDADGVQMTYPVATAYYTSTIHQKTMHSGYDRYRACEGSRRQILYLHGWMSQMTGDPIYRVATDPCYDVVSLNNPSWQTEEAELNLYLHNRYNTPKTDSTPPADIAALTATNLGGGSWRLNWTAPSDNVGLLKYQIKYSEKPMVQQIIYPDQKDTYVNFWAATNVNNEPIPEPPGTLESMTVTGLNPVKQYVFGIRAYDTSNNRNNITLSEVTSIPIILKMIQ